VILLHAASAALEIAANAFDVLVSQIRDYDGSVWTSIVDHPVPLTRHDCQSHEYEGCERFLRAPLVRSDCAPCRVSGIGNRS
jgi:hypothetical protein